MSSTPYVRPAQTPLDEADSTVVTNSRGFPILTPARPCDGRHPTTGQDCIRSYHRGYHRDSIGVEWLDD